MRLGAYMDRCANLSNAAQKAIAILLVGRSGVASLAPRSPPGGTVFKFYGIFT